MEKGQGPRLGAQEQSPPTPWTAPRAPPRLIHIDLIVTGPIARGDIPALCARARNEFDGSGRGQIVCDVGALIDPDAATIDALARLQLTARQLGSRIRLRRACGELVELLELMGLSEVLPLTRE